MRIIPLLFILLSFSLHAQTDPEKEITQVIDRFFQAMADRDTLALGSILTPEGVFYAIPIGSEKGPRAVPHKQFIGDMGKGKEKILERYWEPEIWIGEGIATLRAPYDLHVDRKFSHCGIDVFNLVRMPDGWKISGGMFTMQREGCPESPLGPVE